MTYYVAVINVFLKDRMMETVSKNTTSKTTLPDNEAFPISAGASFVGISMSGGLIHLAARYYVENTSAPFGDLAQKAYTVLDVSPKVMIAAGFAFAAGQVCGHFGANAVKGANKVLAFVGRHKNLVSIAAFAAATKIAGDVVGDPLAPMALYSAFFVGGAVRGVSERIAARQAACTNG
jgi:hypothetical protein